MTQEEPVTVKVLHRFRTANVPFWSEFAHSDLFVQVLKFDCGFPKCGRVEMLLAIVWDQLNIDNPAADWAQKYRKEHHRSLSVGDVVVIGEQAFCCDRAGWSPVTLTEAQVWHDVGKVAVVGSGGDEENGVGDGGQDRLDRERRKR